MSSLEVVLKRSAMSMGSKMAILVQEGCRRIKNCSVQLEWEEKVIHLNKLMVQMKWGGYSQVTREIVAERILGKLDNNLRNFTELDRPLYRSKLQRAQVVKDDKASWFRKEGATATLTVPETSASGLAKRLRIIVASIPGPKGTSVKVLEKPGPPLLQGIAPWWSQESHALENAP